jgi:hypothetical protein
MPEMTPDQAKAQFFFRTDPVFGHVIESLIEKAVAKSDPHRVVKAHAARDFFLCGIALVARPSLVDRPNMSPFDFIVRANGTAEYTRPLPPGFDGPSPTLTPDQFVVLLLPSTERPPLPVFTDEGKVEGWEPWIAAWQKVEPNLDALLAA